MDKEDLELIGCEASIKHLGVHLRSAMSALADSLVDWEQVQHDLSIAQAIAAVLKVEGDK